ncbi:MULTISPECIES: MFS transporter AraJ [unclassified Bacteroides]|jgi:DHA1 family arabinose polymer transporter-like MFS transporter|uniref:MFS transporter AraJ n=1 Tax=unclassified Bacteroides TaxID=2646097 RepID=UPI000E8B3CF1|nr:MULTISPECIES: MFS transporter AraJ [unclassified Bacteroides]RGN51385.1 MFS transporter AraJ [Bacteroides sp. OM05-12]RHR78085.1 MFS transporter AraJ [Bacteroides sp. AF16-49]
MKKSLIALAFGTLGLGIAEFVMMAILPYVAKDLHVSIPTAGHLISAYALGVCAGAPMLTLARKLPLKNILLGLVALMMIGNTCAAFSPNFWTMIGARFISGLPHGAYFGVASIVAEKLADKGKGSEAVSIMIAGMTVANLFGVPLGTSLSTMLSWRLTFLLVGIWCIIVLYYIWKWVPQVEGLPDTGFKGQFRFMKTTAPWLILGATMFGNGGVFCWYSYINPLLTKVSGFSAESITLLMVLAGFGMVVGNLIGGRLSDRYTPGRVAATTQIIICFALLSIFFAARIDWLTALLMCLCTTGLFAVSSPLQISIIHFAKGGELLGAACIQVAFNLGNAIGAFIGGLPLEAGLGYRYPALIGAPLTFVGFVLMIIFFKKYERKAIE